MDHTQGFGHTGPRNIDPKDLKWQVRFNLSDAFAAAVRANPADPVLKPLNDVLAKYNASIKNSGMSFADFLPHFMNDEMPARLAELRTLITDASALRAMEDLATQFVEADARNDVEAGTVVMRKWFALNEGATDAVLAANSEMIDRMGLFLWTKETMLKPETQKKYASRFTVFADGGKEIYDKSIADGLEADLIALKASGMVTVVSKFDSDPAHNPQAPRKFRLG
jgi:hypothetical protein